MNESQEDKLKILQRTRHSLSITTPKEKSVVIVDYNEEYKQLYQLTEQSRIAFTIVGILILLCIIFTMVDKYRRKCTEKQKNNARWYEQIFCHLAQIQSCVRTTTLFKTNRRSEPVRHSGNDRCSAKDSTLSSKSNLLISYPTKEHQSRSGDRGAFLVPKKRHANRGRFGFSSKAGWTRHGRETWTAKKERLRCQLSIFPSLPILLWWSHNLLQLWTCILSKVPRRNQKRAGALGR